MNPKDQQRLIAQAMGENASDVAHYSDGRPVGSNRILDLVDEIGETDDSVTGLEEEAKLFRAIAAVALACANGADVAAERMRQGGRA